VHHERCTDGVHNASLQPNEAEKVGIFVVRVHSGLWEGGGPHLRALTSILPAYCTLGPPTFEPTRSSAQQRLKWQSFVFVCREYGTLHVVL
jgi:hypothetical protein